MGIDPNATFDIVFRPGVEAPIGGPDGSNGTRAAYSPTPGNGQPTSTFLETQSRHLGVLGGWAPLSSHSRNFRADFDEDCRHRGVIGTGQSGHL